ncbi:Nucleotidyl transferase [Staphylothermus marinus F1]|uniref:Nucleotidyl transferase n=1 Tax=Staphylothermus marinus (strain ATCC 43588 / DSM 3639 / JCM 9404 / F1) TaxID=399550 RepID=A3DKS4_STAMF|nr:NDP-sugar synthase [Staphylothermus marinus]ABN69234.1 Nucleotidyl transferase [Staphylothermus marinus F1]
MLEAVILAGGIGSRLRPLTLVKPKPMIPLAGKPLIEHIIYWLKHHGFSRFIVVGKYLGEVIRDYFSGRRDVIVRIVDSKDTADAVRLVRDDILSNDILISMGDVICNADFYSFYKYHVENDGIATIALKEVDNPLQYGVVFIDEHQRIRHFVEKPASMELYVLSIAFLKSYRSFRSNLVNTGFYMINKYVLEIISKYPSLMDWGKHVFPYLVEQGYKVYGWIMDNNVYWEDLGRINNYVKALRDLLSGKIPGFKPAGREVRDKVYIDEGADVRGKIIPPVYIGRNVFIDEKSIIGPYVSIEENSIISGESNISYTIVWENTKIEHSKVYNSIIMNSVHIVDSKISSSIIGSYNFVRKNVLVEKEIFEPKVQV